MASSCIDMALYSVAIASLAYGLGRGLYRRYGLRNVFLVESAAALVSLVAAVLWLLRCII